MKVLFRAIVALIYVFLLAPLVFVVISSLGRQAILAFPPDSISFAWYDEISPQLLDSLWISLEAAAAVTVVSSALGIWIALAIARSDTAFARFLRILSIAPLSVPHLAIGIALYQTTMLFWDATGITLAGNFWGLVLGQSVIALPYVVRGVLAGQAHHQAQVEEAAVSLGARPWRALLEVTIPMIRPGLISGAFLAFFASFDDVPVALFMGGGPDSTTFPLQVLASLEFSLKPDIMALSTLIMIGTILMLVLLDRALGLERLLHGQPTG